MPRLVVKSAWAVSLLILAACGQSTVPADDVGGSAPSVSASPPTELSSAPPSAEPTTQSSAPPPGLAVTDEDLRLIRDFVAFAVHPSAETAGELPFAGAVRLGLSRELKATLEAPEFPDASAWVLDAPLFRANTGPFSALDSLQRHAAEIRSTSVHTRGGAFDVSVGDHPHCVSPPVPAPRGFERERRVSVQPSGSSIDSCLSWFTVDLFLSVGGSITAVTLDIYEP